MLSHRYLAVSLGLALLLLVMGYVLGGRIGMQVMERVESDFAVATVELPYGSAAARTQAMCQRLVKVAQEIVKENGGEKLSKGVMTQVGRGGGGHSGEVRVFLTAPDVRPMGTAQFAQMWRDRVGTIEGVENLRFESDRGGPGSGRSLTVEAAPYGSENPRGRQRRTGRGLAGIREGQRSG